MSGIYIHIPFCKQACHYCDFHFSTSLKKKDAMVAALAKELSMRREAAAGEAIQTIYFGGGTPSLLSVEEIGFLIDAVYSNFTVSDNPEITLEANPDDLYAGRIAQFAVTRINRLSIGIQSFFDSDLRFMNRAHDAAEAKITLGEAAVYFDNISVDLIYGMPGLDDDRWLQNIETALSFGVPHISSYALTVEPKTALHKMIALGQVSTVNDCDAERHFRILTDILKQHGFIHYELSNFAKPGFFSRNNSAYWLGKKYIGIGPSAHSFDGVSRSWNVSNNTLYIDAISESRLPSESELLSVSARYNETIMTGLRTIWGISLAHIELDFGKKNLDYLLRQSRKFFENGLLSVENNVLKTTEKGKFLADGIAADLFLVN